MVAEAAQSEIMTNLLEVSPPDDEIGAKLSGPPLFDDRRKTTG